MKTLSPEHVMALSETQGMMHRLASAEIAAKGFYTCMYDGRKTLVLPDADMRDGNPQGGTRC